MPELPEVETTLRYLSGVLLNKKIQKVEVLFPKIIRKVEVKLFEAALQNQKINEIFRRGKYLFFVLDDWILISHLGMEGKYRFRKNTAANQNINLEHILLKMYLSSQEILYFEDTRRFGKFYLQAKIEYENLTPYKDIGLEPFSLLLTPEYLLNHWKKRVISIKKALLEQKIIAGIGNIYANEILFASQIHPLTQVKKLTISELKRLIFHIQEIMKLAIEYNGTTIATFDINYQKGQFQNFLKVYSRHNKKCLTCSEIIVRFEHNKRGTFYCKKCQPLST